jgi:hypothetical protein
MSINPFEKWKYLNTAWIIDKFVFNYNPLLHIRDKYHTIFGCYAHEVLAVLLYVFISLSSVLHVFNFM